MDADSHAHGVKIARRNTGVAYLVSKAGQTLATATGDLSEAALQGIARETAERFALAIDNPRLIRDATSKTWMSQSGLEFGADNAFGNRIQHVLAHMTPDPYKATHTVFDVQPSQLIPLLDEAWLTVQSLGLQPVLQGSRAVYNIPMGRAVGTTGESSIRIIVEQGTSKIVTAYPVR